MTYITDNWSKMSVFAMDVLSRFPVYLFFIFFILALTKNTKLFLTTSIWHQRVSATDGTMLFAALCFNCFPLHILCSFPPFTFNLIHFKPGWRHRRHLWARNQHEGRVEWVLGATCKKRGDWIWTQTCEEKTFLRAHGNRNISQNT